MVVDNSDLLRDACISYTNIHESMANLPTCTYKIKKRLRQTKEKLSHLIIDKNRHVLLLTYFQQQQKLKSIWVLNSLIVKIFESDLKCLMLNTTVYT